MTKNTTKVNEIKDYDELYKTFKWDVPKYYNFGFDVVDRIFPMGHSG